MKIGTKRIPRVTVRQLVRRANKDPDAASLHYFGENEDDYDGAFLILKGKANTAKLKQFLIEYGYLTPGKRVPE